ERFKQTVGECIAKLLSDKEKEWDEYIDAVLLAYQTMKYESTGFIPFQLMYGRQAKLPIDLKIMTFKKTPITYDEALTKRTFQIIDKMNNEQIKAQMQTENPPQVYLTPEIWDIIEELQRMLPIEVEVKPRPYNL